MKIILCHGNQIFFIIIIMFNRFMAIEESVMECFAPEICNMVGLMHVKETLADQQLLQLTGGILYLVS